MTSSLCRSGTLARGIRILAVAAFVATPAGCASSGQPGGQGGSAASLRPDGLAIGDATSLYRKAGLIAIVGPVSYVGTMGFFAALHADTTLSLLTLSLPTRALTFVREGDRYRAEYAVSADLRVDEVVAHHFHAKETVRVVTYKETNRAEESVIFQEYFYLSPGRYTLALVVRDELGSRTGSVEQEIMIPAINRRGLSSSLPVHDATPRTAINSLPEIIASPRSTAVFGRDSTLAAYVEAYGLGPDERLRAEVRLDDGTILWTDTVSLSQTGPISSGIIRIPVAPLGIGAMNLVLRHPHGGDSVRTPLFVSLGDDLPVASFEEMLSYLIFYASPQRLATLRDASSTDRAAMWVAFLRETDPIPETGHHEALQAYFARIQQANQDFREEGGAGWRTDRGRVFVGLGPADNIVEPSGVPMNQRNTAQIWEYHRLQLQLVFIDQTGFNRWRLTPSSELDFQSAVRREQIR